MTILKNKSLGESLITQTLDSKIKCCVIPKGDFIGSMASIVVKYGASNLRFSCDNKDIETPAGIAHFLEHKIFAHEDINYFEKFASIGGSVNAYTNYDETVYYFNTTSNFYENFELLLEFVFNIYLDEDNIEKEKKVIAQEINMYNDQPASRAYFNLHKAMFSTLPLFEDIAGTISSIQKIDREMLSDCYDAFYRPENTFIVCTGDINPERVFDILEKNLNPKNNTQIKKYIYKEPKEVKEKYVEDKMVNGQSFFTLGFKDVHSEIDKTLALLVNKMAIDMLLGESSSIYEKLHKMALIDTSFSYDYIMGQHFGISLMTGYSNSPKNVLEEIMSHAKFDENRFEQIRRKHLGRFIRNSNNISSLNDAQIKLMLHNADLFKMVRAFDKITPDMVEARIKEHFGDNYVLSVT